MIFIGGVNKISLIKIELEDGKYTALHNEDHGGVTVLRYGEPWRNETGDGFILAMIQHIQKLEDDVNFLKEDSKKWYERCQRQIGSTRKLLSSE